MADHAKEVTGGNGWKDWIPESIKNANPPTLLACAGVAALAAGFGVRHLLKASQDPSSRGLFSKKVGGAEAVVIIQVTEKSVTPQSTKPSSVLNTVKYMMRVILGPTYFKIEYENHPKWLQKVYFFGGEHAGDIYEFNLKGEINMSSIYGELDQRIQSISSSLKQIIKPSFRQSGKQLSAFIAHELHHQMGIVPSDQSTKEPESKEITDTDRGDENDSRPAEGPQSGFCYCWPSGGEIASVQPIPATQLQSLFGWFEENHKEMWSRFLSFCVPVHPKVQSLMRMACAQAPFERFAFRTLLESHTNHCFYEVVSITRRQPVEPMTVSEFEQACDDLSVSSGPPELRTIIQSTFKRARIHAASLDTEEKQARRLLDATLKKAMNRGDSEVLDAFLALEEFELQYCPSEPDMHTRQNLMEIGQTLPNSQLFIKAMFTFFQRQSMDPSAAEQANAQILDLLERIDRRHITRGYLLDNCIASWHGKLPYVEAFRRRVGVLRINPMLSFVWGELGASMRSSKQGDALTGWACFRLARMLCGKNKSQAASLEEEAREELRSKYGEFFGLSSNK